MMTKQLNMYKMPRTGPGRGKHFITVTEDQDVRESNEERENTCMEECL